MKLKAELSEVIKRFESIKDQIPEYSIQLKNKGGYKDFETRLAWDCLHFTFKDNEICEWYKKYDCNDTHITTLAKTALKTVMDKTTY